MAAAKNHTEVCGMVAMCVCVRADQLLHDTESFERNCSSRGGEITGQTRRPKGTGETH
jgi:hypothetical protein